jgi:hypothetical protein
MSSRKNPAHGWTCFHCDETFTTWGSAREHFGSDNQKEPACRIKEGEELGLVIALRKAEASVEEWRYRALHAEVQIEMLEGTIAEYQRIAGGNSIHDLRMKLDSMEGRVVTAEALIIG